MKKVLIVLFCVVLIISGCANDKILHKEHIKKSLENYYSNSQPDNKGELIIEQIKKFEDGYLVMAEKYSGDGHNFDYLFLIDDNYKITHVTSGSKPLSPCFSYNKLYHNGKTILFGTFNDTKWVPETDSKVKVDIKEVYVEPKNSKGVYEKVNFENGYIIVLDGELEINKFEIYNDNKELQAELDNTVAIFDDLIFKELNNE
ncbi:MAG: hypothetical protein E7391_01970 [Ruminococcaceae bacterium]|nr:hypothetical protein [Oscillospiraceae bacterium]